jgi:NAD-dependent dihydropyrimidine dehydrogenase PreA subunit
MLLLAIGAPGGHGRGGPEDATVASRGVPCQGASARCASESATVLLSDRGRAPARREEQDMTYTIAEPCIDVIDQACVAVCPVDCIHFEAGVDRILYIDPNECIDCGACEPECPVNAIFPEDQVPPEWAGYTELNARWFVDKASARATVDEWKPR